MLALFARGATRIGGAGTRAMFCRGTARVSVTCRPRPAGTHLECGHEQESQEDEQRRRGARGPVHLDSVDRPRVLVNDVSSGWCLGRR